METIIPLLTLVVLLVLGVPIAFSLAGAAILGMWLITGDIHLLLGMAGTASYGTVAEYVLSTVPTFVLMAYITSSTGFARDLFDAAAKWLSPLRGGLAIATVFASGVFGAMSGSGVAGASVMSQVAMPHMRRFGYSEELSSGTIAIGATLNILIPPSVALIIYGISTETSIAKLFLAGIIPGCIVGSILTVIIILWATLKPSDAPRPEPVSWSEAWKSLLQIWPILLLIIVVLGLLYTGTATPTEVGAIGAFAATGIGIILKRLTWAGFIESVLNTVQITAMIFMIIIGATLFGYFMTISHIPYRMVNFIIYMDLNRWAIIAFIVIAYFIMSMFMDEIPLLLITIEITFPLIVALGFDPIWYGVLCVMNVAMGLVTPPVGLVGFVVSATAHVDLMKVYKGTVLLLPALILTTLLLMVFPEIALWLPSKMN